MNSPVILRHAQFWKCNPRDQGKHLLRNKMFLKNIKIKLFCFPKAKNVFVSAQTGRHLLHKETVSEKHQKQFFLFSFLESKKRYRNKCFLSAQRGKIQGFRSNGPSFSGVCFRKHTHKHKTKSFRYKRFKCAQTGKHLEKEIFPQQHFLICRHLKNKTAAEI